MGATGAQSATNHPIFNICPEPGDLQEARGYLQVGHILHLGHVPHVGHAPYVGHTPYVGHAPHMGHVENIILDILGHSRTF